MIVNMEIDVSSPESPERGVGEEKKEKEKTPRDPVVPVFDTPTRPQPEGTFFVSGCSSE